MGNIVPPVYVDPAPLEPHRFGLFSIANMPAVMPDRWEAGLEWEPIWGEKAEGRVYACPADAPNFVTISAETNTREVTPFLTVAAYACKATSRSIEDAEERARLYLLGGEERAVESEIVAGTSGGTNLAAEALDITPTPGTPVSLVEAFQYLEESLYENHVSVPAIYLPKVLTARASYDALIMRAGQSIETMGGTYVASGAGFNNPGGKPDYAPDAPAGSVYVFASGRPTVYRSEVFTQPDETTYLNKDDNDVVILAQRAYAVTWSGPVFAVLVDLTACGCDSAEGEA